MDLTLAFKDIQGGLAGWRIWWRLAMLVSREQHKRSVLGPLWNTVGTIVMVLLFGVLYAILLGYETRTHLPYVSCGLVVWILYSEIIIRSCTVFTVSAAFVQQLSLPKSTYVFRVVASELINFFLLISYYPFADSDLVRDIFCWHPIGDSRFNSNSC